MTAAICWQSVCCNYWSNTNQTIIYWLLHFLTFFSCSGFTWGKKYIHYRRPIAVYNVITRWISVFSRIMTLIIICHQNDNDHDYQWDETLRTIPVASESIRFYMSTYSAHYILLCTQHTAPALNYLFGGGNKMQYYLAIVAIAMFWVWSDDFCEYCPFQDGKSEIIIFMKLPAAEAADDNEAKVRVVLRVAWWGEITNLVMALLNSS